MAGRRDTTASADAHNARGIELADRGWLDEAINEFNKAIAIDPMAAHAYDNLAGVYAEQKRYREALAAHLKSLEVDPDNAGSHYNFASFLAAHGLDFAITEFLHTIELEGDFPDAHLNLGLAYADAGDFASALKAVHTAVELEPGDPLARHELANLQMEEGEFAKAISQLKEVTKLEAANFEAWLDLGVCYAQKGFYEEAQRAYETARALKPDEVLLHYNEAALYTRWQQKDRALTSLKAALDKDRELVSRWLKADPMFAPLKGDADFEALR